MRVQSQFLAKKGYDIIVVNTICNATEERQKEASELAAKADIKDRCKVNIRLVGIFVTRKNTI